MEAGKRARAIWRRLRGRDLGAAAAGHVEDAQRTILRTLDGSERAVARVMRHGREDEEAIASAPPAPAPRPFERFDALCAQVQQDTLRIRRARPSRDEDVLPADPATFVERRREATAGLEALARDFEQLEKQLRREQANAEEWRHRAELAVKAEDDALAREALARAREHDALSAELGRELDLGRRVSAELSAALAEVRGEG